MTPQGAEKALFEETSVILQLRLPTYAVLVDKATLNLYLLREYHKAEKKFEMQLFA